MKVVYLRGGLGNQFFQWVHALWLRERGFNVVLDASFLTRRRGNQALGRLELSDVFRSLEIEVRVSDTLRMLEPVWKRVEALRGRLASGAASDGNIISPRTHHHYGYFQTAKYFDGLQQVDLRALLHIEFINPEIRGIDPSLEFSAMHVRRGDYQGSAYNSAVIGALTPEYYKTALAALKDKSNLPVLIVTDDPNFVRTHIASSNENVLLIDDLVSNASDPMTALKVMLRADVLSCANSSFSAMAGYLGAHSSVIAPAPWFRGQTAEGLDPIRTHWQLLPAVFENAQ